MSGVTHWWRQRLSSLLLIPFTLWLLWSGASVAGASHAGAAAFLAQPLNAILAALTVAIVAYHAQSGLQVIIEDYLPRTLGVVLLGLARAGCLAGALILWWAVCRLAIGGVA